MQKLGIIVKKKKKDGEMHFGSGYLESDVNFQLTFDFELGKEIVGIFGKKKDGNVNFIINKYLFFYKM